MNKTLGNLKTGAWFLIPGLIAFAVGYTALGDNSAKENDIQVTGHYVSIDQDRLHATKSSPGSKFLNYPAVVEFADQAGRKHQINTTVSSAGIPAVGSDIKLAYDKSNPDAAHEVSSSGVVMAYVAFAIGVLLVGVGIVLATGVMESKPAAPKVA